MAIFKETYQEKVLTESEKLLKVFEYLQHLTDNYLPAYIDFTGRYRGMFFYKNLRKKFITLDEVYEMSKSAFLEIYKDKTIEEDPNGNI